MTGPRPGAAKNDGRLSVPRRPPVGTEPVNNASTRDWT
ncbi:hypothetical protein SLI_7850 [Streptomyces lividans 1326]|uniref:Uncharacterized protein n=1 Tax=Streptomyces lividans 1326 TaxID=1200984 RepID=A0A7U9DYL0_STRLI|nr:hypothetical protein SLI_7850 [Streptomyces lividans 1326]